MTASLRILVLDDEPIVCERLRPALEKHGHVVETFTDSGAALERLRSESFDVLITDLKMPGPEGIDVLADVRARSPRTRAIVITGFATVDMAKEAMRLGAADFIAKPFRIRQVLDLVQRVAGEVAAEGGKEP